MPLKRIELIKHVQIIVDHVKALRDLTKTIDQASRGLGPIKVPQERNGTFPMAQPLAGAILLYLPVIAVSAPRGFLSCYTYCNFIFLSLL
jgi:hypothetical protein